MADLSFEVQAVSKSFPGVKALDAASIAMVPGKIHALLGENGAGKSTLIKIITGAYAPDDGALYIGGQSARFHSPRDAIIAGIGVVHQERNLIPRFSIAENIMLERLGDQWLKPIDFAAINAAARPWIETLGISADPSTPVKKLSVAQMQMVEIAKALSLQSNVLLLDEPTAALTSHETIAFFKVLGELRKRGVSVLFVSHKLEEVQEICDTVTVLRDGKNACENLSMNGLDRQDLVRMMIGRTELTTAYQPREIDRKANALELSDFSTSIGHRGVGLAVAPGEILGLYGLVGAGRSELAKAIVGLVPKIGGTLKRNGHPIAINSPAEAIHKHRIGYVSEDRKHEGLILDHSVLDNAGITVWRRSENRLGFLTRKSVRRITEPYLKKLQVKTPSLRQKVGKLSGGNQQKVGFAKWMAANCDVLIIDEPTVGIDIKSKADLHDLIRDLASSGTAIILITSDMPEMIQLADRIAVMTEFAISGELLNDGDYLSMSKQIIDLIHNDDTELVETDDT
ncbi:sugar ABC transporter ATP-binding protein [Hoeflea prorocentri]|uniref:Sugar ABC transporter ATP-binding protein n=1 Tax=Hoeflea prorocentri TaxID=1922333 RepID=A0A9X3UJA2_9HYPH|nr:sugar ABC transporter ATP-binding protein [Hoeflea prorocentri]MCY6381878.1 sugar ABC transporter ATP-binding protein [Hoeflea prorocentri]MDA5399678.1 sugar ABC transporter ATP-binding protein [Hoeflea prorocentri]